MDILSGNYSGIACPTPFRWGGLDDGAGRPTTWFVVSGGHAPAEDDPKGARSNEKGSSDFRDWSYELRRMTAFDLNFHKYFRWHEEAELEDSKGKVNREVLETVAKPLFPSIKWLNTQLYGMLAEATLQPYLGHRALVPDSGTWEGHAGR